MTDANLTPTRPYLARAIYEWICDNQLTPYLLVDATQSYVKVPTQHVKDGQIVLNIVPHAVHQLHVLAVSLKKSMYRCLRYLGFIAVKMVRAYSLIQKNMRIKSFRKTHYPMQSKISLKKLMKIRKNHHYVC